MRIEKLRLRHGGGPVRAQRRPLHPGRGAVPPRRRLLRRVRGPPPRRRPRPRRRPPRPARSASLSGGERRRVELARILFAGSDVLLLDEPTNHLDTDAKDWLLGFLRAYRGALLVISHDLDLLDEAITRVLHLDRGGHEDTGTHGRVQGHLHPVRRARARRTRTAWPSWPPRQAKEIDRLQTIVDRFGAKATKASMAHSIEKRIARIEADGVEARHADREHARALPRPPHAGRTVLEVDRPGQGLRRQRGVRRRRLRRRAGASGCWSWASTAPARPASCASSPA